MWTTAAALALLLLACAGACLLLRESAAGGRAAGVVSVGKGAAACWGAVALGGGLAALALARHPRRLPDEGAFAAFLAEPLGLSALERRRYEAALGDPAHPLARQRAAARRRLAGPDGAVPLNGATLVARRAHERLWERLRLAA